MKRTLMMAMALGVSFSLAPAQTKSDKREDVQQKRVEQGQQSGELAPSETRRTERSGERHSDQADRMEKTGTGVNSSEERRTDRKQDRDSKQIRRNKTDRRDAPGK